MNPFITTGYAGEEFFCDRKKETKEIVSLLENGNNIALISHRRIGKTDLIRHCLSRKELNEEYFCFLVDIYATNALADFVNQLGKSILESLKPKGKKVWGSFLNFITSIKPSISYDAMGNPSWALSVSDIKTPQISLDEIFRYIQSSDRKCIIAIDEFQQILKYPEENIEAILRTYIQQCSNANFIFAGSSRHLMGSIFTSPSRPFYQSVTIIDLPIIDRNEYIKFCKYNFEKNGKKIEEDVVDSLYSEFSGVTLYLQKVMNILYMNTEKGQTCNNNMLGSAIDYVVNFSSSVYENLIYQLPQRQREVLIAIAKEHIATEVLSGLFVNKHKLLSASSVKSAVKGLLEKDLITSDMGDYQVYDKFLEKWLLKNRV